MTTENDEVVQEFLIESYENLDRLDQDLVTLERSPDDVATLSSIFRTIHTIKGTCGFLGFSKLESVAHVGEGLLSRLRDRELHLTEDIVSGLLQMVDAVREVLASIETTGEEGVGNYDALVARLHDLQQGTPTIPAQPAAPAAETAAPLEAPKIGEVLVASGSVTPAQVTAAVEAQGAGDPRPVGELLMAEADLPPGDLVDALQTQAEARATVADHSIRVDVALLDKLMNLVGELVLARNRVLQFTRTDSDPGFISTSQRLNLITSELQEGVMKTRMQPVGNVWSKFPRVVRDLSVLCGKQVRIEMEGEETELDKTIIEAIKDPLTHIVRNSVDHGIEPSDKRVAAGKPAEGTLLMRAFHEGGQVNLEISDDGGGIDADVIGAKAVEKGLLRPEELARMSAREIVNLVFLPGFSTAAKVTNVSGRGVGMDVVKTNIEKIGGTIDVQSRVGHGTTFRIKIPLTLAIIPALTVTCAGDRYAIPQVSLLELVRLEGEAIGSIEQIHGAPVYRLRGNLLPLVYLDRELAVGPGQLAKDRDTVFIVVLQADERQFGLVVDDVCDTEEIVVKPLGKQLKGINGLAGATILGDGRVALILDVLALAQQANVLTGGRERAGLGGLDRDAAAGSEVESMLVVGIGEGRRAAIPLAMVTRLEEFPLRSVEHVGNHEVVQYREQILPLVRLSNLLGSGGGREADEDATISVVVYSEGGRSVGLVVEEILDIAEQALTARSDLDGHGLVGSAVVQEQITELLDVRSAILAADPYFYATAGV